MYIQSLTIKNFKGYENLESLKFTEGKNIIVGDNEAKKSTILEAINLVFTGTINGKYLTEDTLDPYLFNNSAVNDFIENVKKGNRPEYPPEILIELFFSDDTHSDFQGSENSFSDKKAKGIYLRIALMEEHKEYYQNLDQDDLRSLPIELYSIELRRFSGGRQPRALLPIKGSFIDTSSNFQNASDQTISKILKQNLNTDDKIKASQFYRGLKENYKEHEIHSKLEKHIDHPNTSVSIDPSSKNAWHTHLSVYIKDIPFAFVGKGLQTILKTKVALSSKKTEEASVVLIEEPENHLSHSTLNELVSLISNKYGDKQIIITSHNSYVANKLNLVNLILLNDGNPLYFNDLDEDTQYFFEKLPGYDTLRLLLSKQVILVEGDADELVVQKIYKDINVGTLPIENGIDVISVNNTFGRFFQLAKPLKKDVALIIDLDNKKESREALKKDLKKINHIDVFFEENDEYKGTLDNYNNNTLEPLLLKYNGIKLLNRIFNKDFKSDDEILKFMKDNKTQCALDIFKFKEKITPPKYIVEALNFLESEKSTGL